MKKCWRRLSALLLALALTCPALPAYAHHVYYSDEDAKSSSAEIETLAAEDAELDGADTALLADEGEADASEEEPAEAEDAAETDEDAETKESEDEPESVTHDVGGTYNVADFMASESSPRRAIQAALNQAALDGGATVRIPAGTYYLDGALTIYSNTHLVAEDGAVLVRANDQYCMLHSPNAEASQSTGYNSAQNIIVEGGVWDGNSTGSSSTKSLMVFRHCQGLTFQRFTLTHGTHHFLNVSSSADVLVERVTFSDAVELSARRVREISPLSTAEARARFECIHTDVEGASGNAGHDGTVPQNITVTRCVFQNVYAGVGTHNLPSYKGEACYAQNIAVTKNRFENVWGRCVNAFQFNGVTISGNTCKQVASLALLQDSTGIIAKNKVTLQTVSGVDTCGVQALSCPLESGLTISGNTIKGEAERLLNLQNCTNLVVSENTLKGGTETAIYLSASPDARVNDNSISHAGEVGIYLATDSGNGVVSGNSVEGTDTTENGIYVTDNTGTTLTCNQVKDSAAAGIYLSGTAKDTKLSFNDTGEDPDLQEESGATKTVLTPEAPTAVTGTQDRTLTVSWQKIVPASGYQIEYARVKSFKHAKVVNIASKGMVKKIIVGEKRRTKYFIRIRAYKIAGGVRYYTAWSDVTSGRTK